MRPVTHSCGYSGAVSCLCSGALQAASLVAALPEHAACLVTTDWVAFERHATGADCAVVWLEWLDDASGFARLLAFRARLPLEPLVLVTQRDADNARHLSWQGRCRELFLRAHAPDVVEALSAGLSLVTLRCSCEYYAELRALEEVVIRMRLDGIAQNRIALRFDYARVDGTGEQPVARGHQDVACMRRDGGRLVPAAIPESLCEALRAYEHAGVVA